MARCTGHQHVRGAWVEASEAAVAYGPPGCSKDGDNFMTRPNSCGTQRTVHSPYMDTGCTVKAKRTWPLAHMGGNACSCVGHVVANGVVLVPQYDRPGRPKRFAEADQRARSALGPCGRARGAASRTRTASQSSMRRRREREMQSPTER